MCSLFALLIFVAFQLCAVLILECGMPIANLFTKDLQITTSVASIFVIDLDNRKWVNTLSGNIETMEEF